MPKKFRNDAEVLDQVYDQYNKLASPTGSPQNKFSRATRICLVVNAEGKVLKESNYLDCLYYCATNEEKALRVEFLQSKIPSFYERLRDSEALAKQLLAGNAVYINTQAKTLSESLIAENDALEKISIPNDVLSGPVDLNSIEHVAGNIEKNNPNCVLIVISSDEPEEEIGQKMDQVSKSIPSSQVRPLYSSDNPPVISLPMLEDFGYPADDTEKEDTKEHEYTNNHQGEPATTRDSTDQGQKVEPTAKSPDQVKDAPAEAKKNSDSQYAAPKAMAKVASDSTAMLDVTASSEVPTSLNGNNSAWLGKGV